MCVDGQEERVIYVIGRRPGFDAAFAFSWEVRMVQAGSSGWTRVPKLRVMSYVEVDGEVGGFFPGFGGRGWICGWKAGF